jgi:hypothetical protein
MRLLISKIAIERKTTHRGSAEGERAAAKPKVQVVQIDSGYL